MQIHRGVDISTAKATHSEQAQATHHMLYICDEKTKSFTVDDFRDAALPIFNRLQNAGRNRWRNNQLCRKFLMESAGVTATEYSMFRFKRCTLTIQTMTTQVIPMRTMDIRQ